MELIIKDFLQYFPSIMTFMAIILSFLHILIYKNYNKADIFLTYLFVFAVAFSGFWGFIFHAFLPELSAEFIGWQNSPFQFEVAIANLGMGLLGAFSFNASKSFRKACVLFVTVFLWGAAVGHVIQMQETDNFAPGNAGLIFYNDLILPILLIICLGMSPKFKHQFLR